MTTELTLPFSSLSRNQLDKMHWRTRYRLRVKYTNMILTLVRARQPGPVVGHPGPVRIHYTRAAPRRLDHDNLVGGLKILQDALKQAGIIKDDTTAIIVDPQYAQLKVPAGGAHTHIRIEDFQTP